MKLPIELLFLTSFLFSRACTAPMRLNRRAASFLSLRGLTTIEHDYSNSESFSHPTKFFHESTFSYHYDGRFASAELPHYARNFHLRLLLRAYVTTMAQIGVKTWLMHGCLLGWWWNARIMPWDSDIDFMVDEPGMSQLGTWWNMTIHRYTPSELYLSDSPHADSGVLVADDQGLGLQKLHQQVIGEGGKKYLLEVNPHYSNASTRDSENVIDARWIDTATGLFIDVTTIHVQPYPQHGQESAAALDTDEEQLYTKDKHAYLSSDIFPLRTSTFENVTVHIPFGYEELLLDEYGPDALTQTWFRGWKFDTHQHVWVNDGADEVRTVYRNGNNADGDERYRGKGREAEYMFKAGPRASAG
ncbi:mannosyltransferase [Pleosporales sp. CAS-2024a]